MRERMRCVLAINHTRGRVAVSVCYQCASGFMKDLYSCWRPDPLLNLDPSLKHASSEMLEEETLCCSTFLLMIYVDPNT